MRAMLILDVPNVLFHSLVSFLFMLPYSSEMSILLYLS